MLLKTQPMVKIALAFVAGIVLASIMQSKPKAVIFNMSEDERPFEVVLDTIESDTIYISVFKDTLKTKIK